MCNYYNIGFGYAKDHNFTMEEVYEKILLDLRSEKNVGTGLTNILENMFIAFLYMITI